MKTRLIRVVIGILSVLPFVVMSCMMNDGEDIPNFNEQLQKDLDIIDTYLTNNQIDAEQDVDGLIRYVVHRDSTTTPKPKIDSCAVVNYAGFLLSNGQKFDEGKNFAFPIGGVIDGWKIGIPLMNVGDSITLYIPSGLAYGYYGFKPDIPSNANLIFHVGLKDIGQTYKSSGGGSCD